MNTFDQSWGQIHRIAPKKQNSKKNCSKPGTFTGLGKIVFLGIAFLGFSFFCYQVSDFSGIDWILDKIISSFN